MTKIFIEVIKIIFIIITIILSIILISIKLFGNSPTEDTILLSVTGILVALQVVIISILFQVKEDVGNLKEFKRQTISKIKEMNNKIK